MKNKKILSRILALCSVAVLLFALALPCFADAPADVPGNIVQAFYDGWNVPNTPIIDFVGARVFEYNAVTMSILSRDPTITSLLPMTGYGVIASSCDFVFYNTQYDSYITGEDVLISYAFDADNQTFVLNIGEEDAGGIVTLSYYMDGSSVILDTITATSMLYPEVGDCSIFIGFKGNVQFMNDFAFLLGGSASSVAYPVEFYNGYIANSGGSVVEPTRSGMFGQLYYILRDAIYGENVVIDSTQDFALTLVVTLLVLCVVLLPVLLVVAIMFKLFRW